LKKVVLKSVKEGRGKRGKEGCQKRFGRPGKMGSFILKKKRLSERVRPERKKQKKGKEKQIHMKLSSQCLLKRAGKGTQEIFLHTRRRRRKGEVRERNREALI